MMVTIFKPTEIISVADLAGKVRKLSDADKFLFRGQNTDTPLLPKILRERKLSPSELESVERRMFDRFKKESIQMLSGVQPNNDWDLLSIAQHQGLPTRLLDWSTNVLAALWFAISTDPPNGAPHGVLWCLKVNIDDLIRPDQDVFSLSRTYVFQPFHIDKRIAAQSGWFSVHNYAGTSATFVPLDENISYKEKMKKYAIPRKEFAKLRHDLRIMGITQASLFPDLGGLCADIQEEYLKSQRDVEKI